MTSEPEESVRLQGFGEMTLRTAIGTVMLLAPRERADATIFRVRDGVRLASSEIAELASEWGIAPAADIRSPKLVRDRAGRTLSAAWCERPRCHRCWWRFCWACW